MTNLHAVSDVNGLPIRFLSHPTGTTKPWPLRLCGSIFRTAKSFLATKSMMQIGSAARSKTKAWHRTSRTAQTARSDTVSARRITNTATWSSDSLTTAWPRAMTKSALSSSPCSSSLQSASGSGKMSPRPSTSRSLNTQTSIAQYTNRSSAGYHDRIYRGLPYMWMLNARPVR